MGRREVFGLPLRGLILNAVPQTGSGAGRFVASAMRGCTPGQKLVEGLEGD